MRYTYLLVDMCALLVPLLFSFHSKIRFDRQWYSFFVACLVTGTLFVAWDMFFMRMNVWGFNPRYIIGLYLGGLPIEEILFFICIPYSCVFTFYCLDQFYDLRWRKNTEDIFTWCFAILLVVVGSVYITKWYTAVTFISTAITVLLLRRFAGAGWFGKYLTVYALLLIPFFIVNGILTGTGLAEPVVYYNDAENLGLRVLTIPVEDIIYGFELVMLNTFIFQWMRKRKNAENDFGISKIFPRIS